MAANKFATMLHRNTNKISMILIYAVLEWTLIVLLLLNSLFSYLIIKFSEYFGLKPPCLWCSRVDHIFHPGKNTNIHRDLLCEAHAKEISNLGYCSNHQKLAASQDMCEDCSSSMPEFHGVPKNFTFFGMIQTDGEKVVGNGDVSLNCSCCGVTIVSNILPHIVIKPSWDILEYAKKGRFTTEAVEDDQLEKGLDSDENRSDFSSDQHGFENKDEIEMLSDVNGYFSVREKEADEDGFVLSSINEVEKVDAAKAEGKEENLEETEAMFMKDQAIQVSVEEDASLEMLPEHLEFFIDCSGYRLVPVELIDSATEEKQFKDMFKVEDQEKNHDQSINFHIEVLEGTNSEVDIGERCTRDDADHSVHINEESKFALFESMEVEEDENSLVFSAKECSKREVNTAQVAQPATQDSGDVQQVETEHSDVHPVCEDDDQIQMKEAEGEVSIGREVSDFDIADEMQTQVVLSSYLSSQEDPSTSSVEVNGHVTYTRSSSFCLESNEIEEDGVPDTPTSVDSLHHLHKRILLLEKNHSGTEDSLDGSVSSELERVDGIATIEQLKSALRAERKALHALYLELEEERNASEIAASQTMAMINRLQEEKAAMQMEALQYQRMMEEQADYDQEALQILNELMVKREREKEELEKELEICRKKLSEYETKEKIRILRRSNNSPRKGSSSHSCSIAEDNDASSFDPNHEAKEGNGFYSHQESENENTPVNAVLNMDESIADFEEERFSILEQLKNLEGKLMALDDEDLQHYHEENGNHTHENGHFHHGLENGFQKEMNGQYYPENGNLGRKGKSLLPLFESTSDENGDIVLNGFDSNGMHKYTSPMSEEKKRLVVEEELDHLYERLQAFEADREFFKHCISSLNKGEKGIYLLHEILHHLKDLRDVELRVRSLSDGPRIAIV